MKALIDHLIRTNWEEIVSKSLLHCHVKGVHSIMLLDCPEKRIRLFVAESGSPLQFNHPSRNEKGLSIAFHPHHCDLTLHVVKGKIFNWIVQPTSINRMGLTCMKFIYNSGITANKTSFEYLHHSELKTVSGEWLRENESEFMKAREIHTVGTEAIGEAAWMVYEGKEDKDYCPISYSNVDLCKCDFSGLYQKPTQQQVIDILTSVF